MAQISRLRWLCRRGMKELDVVLEQYLERDYSSASAEEQQQFRDLLELTDPDLYNLLLGRGVEDSPERKRLLQKLRFKSGAS